MRIDRTQKNLRLETRDVVDYCGSKISDKNGTFLNLGISTPSNAPQGRRCGRGSGENFATPFPASFRHRFQSLSYLK